MAHLLQAHGQLRGPVNKNDKIAKLSRRAEESQSHAAEMIAEEIVPVQLEMEKAFSQ